MEKKLIVVDSVQNVIELYEEGKKVKTLKKVFIGKNGLTDNKQEGDFCTPKGIYNLGFAFGTKEGKFEYPYYKINNDFYWVDDHQSPYYNKMVLITEDNIEEIYSYFKTSKKITWNSAEHLIDFPIEYELAFVIEYNVYPCIPENGSGIFLHIQKPNKTWTSGCVATTKENLLFIINWLGKDKSKILIK